MAKLQVYKATQTAPLYLKAPHDRSSKLFYEFNYNPTVDSDGNTLDPYLTANTTITTSTWDIFTEQKDITLAEWLTDVATLTVLEHGYEVGESITIRNMDPIDYNGTFTITAITADTFSYALVGDPGAIVSYGTSERAIVLDNDTNTTSITRVRVGIVPDHVTEFTLTNHITITYQSGDVEEDERSILVSVVDR